MLFAVVRIVIGTVQPSQAVNIHPVGVSSWRRPINLVAPRTAEVVIGEHANAIPQIIVRKIEPIQVPQNVLSARIDNGIVRGKALQQLQTILGLLASFRELPNHYGYALFRLQPLTDYKPRILQDFWPFNPLFFAGLA